MPWEYKHVQVGTGQLQDLEQTLNRLGAEAWEVVGFASSDKTVGFNSVVCILKRHYESMPPPADVTKGWKKDPAGHPFRWWTGEHWSVQVSDEKNNITIAPPRMVAQKPS